MVAEASGLARNRPAELGDQAAPGRPAGEPGFARGRLARRQRQGPEGAHPCHGLLGDRDLQDPGLLLVLPRQKGPAHRSLSRERPGGADRPGPRDVSRRQRQRLDLRLPVHAVLSAGRRDRRRAGRHDPPDGVFGPRPLQPGFPRASRAPGGAGRSGRAEPDRRERHQSVPRHALQDRRADHRHAAGGRPPHRLRHPDLLRQVRQVRPGVPVPGHPLRGQGDLQRLRDLEAGQRALHPLPGDQPQGLGLRALRQGVPAEQGHHAGRSGPAPGGVLARHQRHVAEAGAGPHRHPARRRARQRQPGRRQEMVAGPGGHGQEVLPL